MNIIRGKIIAILLFVCCMSAPGLRAQNNPGYFKIQDIEGEVTKKVNLWGYINRPGRYEVPLSTNLIQLITYAGGPKEHAVMEDIKIYRLRDDGSRQIIEVDLEDPAKVKETLISLYDEDTVIIEYSSLIDWREIFGLISAPVAVLASIALIVDRITNK
ncbi:MAG: SLBB domain-containing protein [Bacteroidota bacterium]